MPYRTNDDLPVSVTAHLPYHAQDIYREAFNHAYAAHSGDVRQKEAAHRSVGRGEALLRQGRRKLDCTRRAQWNLIPAGETYVLLLRANP